MANVTFIYLFFFFIVGFQFIDVLVMSIIVRILNGVIVYA